jgi:hypothetical protein
VRTVTRHVDWQRNPIPQDERGDLNNASEEEGCKEGCQEEEEVAVA